MPSRRAHAVFTPAVVVLVAVATHAARAQNAERGVAPASRAGEQALEVWAGLARHSPQLGPLGDTPGMNLALAAGGPGGDRTSRWTTPPT